MIDVIDYYWDDQTETATFVYEDDSKQLATLENLTWERSWHQPLKAPELSEPELRAKYFAELQYWLETQPQEPQRW